MSTITIIGGHGKVALLATPLLIEAGHTVRSVIRKEEQVADIEALGATPIMSDIGELNDEDLAQLLEGNDAIIWSAGAGGGSEERTWAVDRDAAIRVIDAAQRVGVRRFLMVSFFNSQLVDGEYPGVGRDEGMYAYYNAKAQADEYLRRTTDLQWTVLGPSALTLEPATGAITVDSSQSSRDLDVPSTSRANVAALIAAVLEEPAAHGKTFNFHDGDTPIVEATLQGI